MEECIAPAVGYVWAQWSLVDFLRYESCYEHMREMVRDLDRRTVDGNLPMVGVEFYDD
jgi:hypothetical protein